VSIRVAINGFGRIGRSVFRILSDREDVDVIAINDLADPAILAYLLKHDTVMGTFRKDVVFRDGRLEIDGAATSLYADREPATLPWRESKIDVVIEATGRFRKRAELEGHIQAGAGKVILTVPPKDEIDATVVIGVNDGELRPEHRIISNASCTTNCLAPIAKVLHDRFGLERGLMTTVHAYTNDQRLADVPHKDLRRSRAAAENIIPTTTGAAVAVGTVLPALAGRLDGIAMRVPVPDGSVVDLVSITAKPVTVDAVNEAMREAAEGEMKGILEYCTTPIVSTDIIGNAHSSIYDSLITQVVGEHHVRVLAWYDNEWGYSCRVSDLLDRVVKG
jgi:glyceraldehyde 3-phosphate dehydrogenase